ncbi:hypothetical protein FNAPI_12335 [Fusarium napiforme]|uniref:Ankyrin repeat protein n=1 Tax=Fusarium napiforme TaxID=42672 RepID=A0A8H5MLJ6_9HYPO|nr:hypothetical protein FNAPI_12335 [Fusarium napiforme]
MSLFSKAHIFSALLLLLEVLVYLEDLLYEVIWFRWQPSSTTVLEKLVMGKEDEIWHAVIYGDDGDMRKAFEDIISETASNIASSNSGVASSSVDVDVTSASGKMEAGILFSCPRTRLQKAVQADVTKNWKYHRAGYESAVQARLESIADQLANSSRKLTKKEILQVQDWSSNAVSILWAAITRGHKSDVNYLLRQRNQKLLRRNGDWHQTVLHMAVSNKDLDLARDILEESSSTSPQTYINAEDDFSRTALHILVDERIIDRSMRNRKDLEKTLQIFDLLCRHGANINALDGQFMTPLHQLLSRALNWKETDLMYELIVPVLERLLQAGAEVNTKDTEGNSPLHIACRLQNQYAIKVLVCKGADLETLNHDGKTPSQVFFNSQRPGKEFWKQVIRLCREKQISGQELPAVSDNLLQKRERIPKARRAVCDKSLVYCRYQQNSLAAQTSNPLYWTTTDKSVSEVLYSTTRPEDVTFLAQCQKECQSVEDDRIESSKGLDQDEKNVKQRSAIGNAEKVDGSVPVAKDVWRWVNFSANNMTWIRDFIKGNTNFDSTAWRSFDDNIKVRDIRMNASRIMEPHAHILSEVISKSSKNELGESTKTGSIVSLAYSTQSPDDPLEWRVRNPFSKLANLLRKVRRLAESYGGKQEAGSSFGRNGQAIVVDRAGASTGMQRILKDRRPKWLMVRQLWLWKLADGEYLLFPYFDPCIDEPFFKDTILTAIPSRRSRCMADDLLETIKQSGLHGISDVDNLMKHIVQETIKFPARFRRAGLGEHILDIFESEIASEADEEATFYNNFAENEWDSKQANRAINCTWRVKDIRDELRLIRNVFTSQLKVVKQFSKVLAPQQPKTSVDSEYIRSLLSEIESIITRIAVMDSEAARTTDSAMLAQAALKEAEAARFMNFIILPFTIVTVIFTPLSFMTSLFAVNSDSFPHNEDGELRIPSDWFWRRMESTTTTEAPACVETQVVVNPGFDDSASSKSPCSFVFFNGGGDAQISQTLTNLDGTYRLSYNWGVFSGVNVGSGFACSIIPKVGDDVLPGVYPDGYSGWAAESQTWSSGSSAVAQADLSLVLQCGGEYDQLTINVDDITFTKLCGPQAS